MTFLEKLNTLDRMDQLVRLKATGPPKTFADKLGVSKRNLFNLIDLMKQIDAPIFFCSHRKSYYYDYECGLMIGFIKKINLSNSFSSMATTQGDQRTDIL